MFAHEPVIDAAPARGVQARTEKWQDRRMPLIQALPANPLLDGRQSQRAMVIRRGVQRLLAGMGAHVIPELSLSTGRRADLVALTRQGDIWIIEIKSSIEDFRVDRKWPDYRLHSDRFFFASHPEVPAGIFPEECGFILSDGYGAEIMREAPEHRLAAATRKAMMLRFARAGAARLLAAELAGVPVAAIDGESE
jgi:hypothetical protein